jgi:hypothetical protein
MVRRTVPPRDESDAPAEYICGVRKFLIHINELQAVPRLAGMVAP